MRADGEPQVVIVGAGPTGVAAAILLGQYGVRCLVLDRWADVYPQPRAVHLDDEVFRLLARLGVAEEFAAVTIPGAGLRLLSPQHEVLAQFDRSGALTSNGYPQANMFDQPDLERILRDRLKQLDCVELRGGVEVTGVRTAVGGRPVVRLDDGNGGAEETITADVVLGCDGAKSVVRSTIGSTMRDLGFEQRWLVVDIATDRALDHWGGVHQVCDSTRAATYMQIGPGRYRWEFQLLDGETAALFGTLADLAPLIAPWEPDTSGFELVRVSEYTFRAQLADRWRSGRVLLLGDAAHLTPPFIGQGLGAGLRDATNLAWKVAGVLGGTLGEAVLDSYEAERKPHAEAMVTMAVDVGRAMTGGGRVGDRVRSRVVPHLTRLPGLRRRVVDSTTPALSRGRLVRSAPTRRLPGTLCPNVAVGPGRRLDDLAAGRFLVVHRGGRCEPGEVPGAVTLAVAAGHPLAAWLGRAHAALVRPDGTVLAAGRGLDPARLLGSLG